MHTNPNLQLPVVDRKVKVYTNLKRQFFPPLGRHCEQSMSLRIPELESFPESNVNCGLLEIQSESLPRGLKAPSEALIDIAWGGSINCPLWNQTDENLVVQPNQFVGWIHLGGAQVFSVNPITKPNPKYDEGKTKFQTMSSMEKKNWIYCIGIRPAGLHPTLANRKDKPSFGS